MTSHSAQPAPPSADSPPTPPHFYGGGPPVPRIRSHRRAGIAAAAAFVIAAAAATTTAIALASPATPAQHTINIVPAPPMTYSSEKIQAAKDTACTAWDQAARAIASAGKLRAALAKSTGGSSIDTEEARTDEKLTTASQIAFLRTELSPVTPPVVGTPISDWITEQIDSMHGVNVRDWNASEAATKRGNDLVDVIAPACGLR
jgi:hypothetical protein